MELQQISSTNATMPCLPTTSVPLHFLCTSISHHAMTRCLPTTTTPTRVLSVSLSPPPGPSLGSFFPFLQFLDEQGGVPTLNCRLSFLCIFVIQNRWTECGRSLGEGGTHNSALVGSWGQRHCWQQCLPLHKDWGHNDLTGSDALERMVQIPLQEKSSAAGKLHVMSKEITWDSLGAWNCTRGGSQSSLNFFYRRILG
jgi:hypothetical protein